MRTLHNPFGDVMSLKRRGHAKSEGREILGLAAAAAIFLLGLPGHSDAFTQSAQHMVRQFIRLVLVFLGLTAPTPLTQTKVSEPVKKISAPTVIKKKPIVDPNSMFLGEYGTPRRYLYKFEGIATYKGEACPSASVLVRIVANDRTITKGGFTGPDGSYSIEIPVDATDSAPVDWHMEAFTPEFKKVELSGRRIVQQEEEESKAPIVVDTPVKFNVSLSK